MNELLALDWREVMLLEDRIKEHRDAEDGIAVKLLLTKLAGLYLELILTPPLSPVAGFGYLAISEQETWFLRRIVRSADAIQQVNVGIGLLRKLYEILLSYQSDAVADGFSDAVAGVPVHSIGEWKEHDDARASDDANQDYDAGTNA